MREPTNIHLLVAEMLFLINFLISLVRETEGEEDQKRWTHFSGQIVDIKIFSERHYAFRYTHIYIMSVLSSNAVLA